MEVSNINLSDCISYIPFPESICLGKKFHNLKSHHLWQCLPCFTKQWSQERLQNNHICSYQRKHNCSPLIKEVFSPIPQILWVVSTWDTSAELMISNVFITKVTTNEIEMDTNLAACSPTLAHLLGSFLILLRLLTY